MLFPLISSAVFLLAVPAYGADWSVNVGKNGQLSFDPQSLTGVNSGDVVAFTFHSATQSSFSTPCDASSGGFDTGLIDVSNNPIVMNWTVPSGDGPWWFFCKQSGHCGAGMVFAVNPTASQTFDTFKAIAQGQTPPPASSSSPSSTGSVTASNTSNTSPSSSSPTNSTVLNYGFPLAFSLLFCIAMSAI
ncbi:hypothetical protein CPB84DRAFT_1783000 [Gymnopilus junonius]|uniref:Phytocyanin domain-containing protein n=1 Tax=Gymnopilus junonius TaxID=109634 RepID=A0A9P5NLM3_GYMJU|nr:hypothetical protein CPB84DRAFT_1783000 [Gymnopilus junonius]